MTTPAMTLSWIASTSGHSYLDYYMKDHMADERAIVNRMIRAALAANLTVSVFDGEEWGLRASSNYAAITAEVAVTDQTTLRFRDASKKLLGSIYLVHGNGDEVISDHTDNALMRALAGLAECLSPENISTFTACLTAAVAVDAPRYIIMDAYSGFIWADTATGDWANGIADLSDLCAVCRAMDESTGTHGRSYEAVSRISGDQGYILHRAPDDFPTVMDGQNSEEVARAVSLPVAGYVMWKDAE